MLMVATRLRSMLARVSRPARGRVNLIRAGLTAGRATDADERRKSALRAEVAGLAPLNASASPAARDWMENRAQLRRDVQQRDPRFFLRWSGLIKTMVVPPAARYVVDFEIPALRAAGWLPLLSEDVVGSPRRVRGTSTSGNLAHHAYHLLRFEQETGHSPGSFDDVVEIGAGYGSMARLIYRLSLARVHLTLVDLPEFSALQRYFLSSLDIEADLVASPTETIAPAQGPRLLVATWSLSEIPIADRDEILRRVGVFDAYLFAYQDTFQEADNRSYFDELARRWEADVDWLHHQEIAHLPANRYLFGVRRT